jgi:hypothetical protein
MGWIKDGEQVAGEYFGQPFEGVVSESRVKYGGRVQYTVELDTPITLKWRDEPVNRVLVEAEDLTVPRSRNPNRINVLAFRPFK